MLPINHYLLLTYVEKNYENINTLLDIVNNGIDKLKEKKINNNPLCTINNNKNYYKNIYNYLLLIKKLVIK